MEYSLYGTDGSMKNPTKNRGGVGEFGGDPIWHCRPVLASLFGFHFIGIVGFSFGMSLFGTISFTFWTVGAKGLIFLGCFGWKRFRWASVNGVVLIRCIPLRGGRSGRSKPSSRRASHSENVVNFMPICSRVGNKNKKKHRVMQETSRG